MWTNVPERLGEFPRDLAAAESWTREGYRARLGRFLGLWAVTARPERTAIPPTHGFMPMAPESIRTATNVAIVGGGVTGLTLLHYLRRRNVDASLYEASSRVGGVVGTKEKEGMPLELGPQRARLDPALRELVEELDLGEQLVEGPRELRLMVYRRGRLRRAPLSPMDALRTDLLSFRGKLRVLHEPFRAGPGADESVGSFLRRAFGEEAYTALLAPLYGGLYASDPDEMLMRVSLGRLLEERGLTGRSLLLALLRGARQRHAAPPPVSFARGLATLPRALAAAHADHVHVSTPVAEVEAAGDVSRWRLRLGSGGSVDAHAVVLTTPAPASGRLLRAVAPEAAAALEGLRYNPLAVVHLQAEESLPWAGLQVAKGEDTPLRGVTSHGALFRREGLHTAFLGGMGREDVVGWADERLGEAAREAFARVTGLRASILHVHRTHVPAWDRTWTALDRFAEHPLPEGLRLAGSWHERPGLPGRWREARRLARELSGELDRMPPNES